MQQKKHMKYIKSLFMALIFALCVGAGVQAAGIACTTVYAEPAADESADAAVQEAETEEDESSVGLIVFMAVILLICIVAVIVAVSSVTVSLPIIEFFE